MAGQPPPARRGRARSRSFHSVEDHPGDLPDFYILQELNQGLALSGLSGLGLGLETLEQAEVVAQTETTPIEADFNSPRTSRRHSEPLNHGLGLVGLGSTSTQPENEGHIDTTPAVSDAEWPDQIIRRELNPVMHALDLGISPSRRSSIELGDRSVTPCGPRPIPQDRHGNNEDVMPGESLPPPAHPLLANRALPAPPAEFEAFHPHNLGIPTQIAASAPREVGILSADFSNKVIAMEEDEELVFCQSKSFGTRVEIQTLGRRTTRCRLIFDMFVAEPGAEKNWEEIQMRVTAQVANQGHIALLTACAGSAHAITAFDTNKEPVFVAKGTVLFIRYLEVSRQFERCGAGREMVDLLIGQARAHGMREVQVWPVSFRGDGDLGNGKEKANTFFKALGFMYTAKEGNYPSPYWMDLREPGRSEAQRGGGVSRD